MLQRLIDALVLRRPWLPLLAYAALLAGSALLLPGFRLDADSDSLTLESDPARVDYADARKVFGSDDYVILAMAPPDPWSAESLARVDALAKDLEALKTVTPPGRGPLPAIARVVSPTNQRLFRSLPDDQPAMAAAFAPVTPVAGGADLRKARAEMTGSALYAGNLVSPEGDAFAVIAYFADGREKGARRERDEAARRPGATEAETAAAHERWREASDEDQDRLRAIVAAVRAIAARDGADRFTVYASGVPTIVVDMVNAIEEDIVLFGVFATGFMVLVLAVALRRVRWVVLPVASVLVVVAVVVAATVLAGKKTTIVTSNLSSLLLIVGMAHAIHIAVHYREVLRGAPGRGVRETVSDALAGIAVPCLYACLTTAVGFASIAVSDIRPCIDFGLFMAAGTVFAYLVSFTLIPAGMVLIGHERLPPPTPAHGRRPMAALGRWTLGHGTPILVGSAAVFVASVAGMARLEVETRFTDYFRAASPIAQGLGFIDRRIGGTTPLEVVLRGDRPGYFLEEENFRRLEEVHAYLRSIPEAGTVLSLASLKIEGTKILESAMPGSAAQSPPLKTLVEMSENLLGKAEVRRLVGDYASEDYATVRLLVRIRESSPTLSRQRLLADLREFLAGRPGLAETRPVVTGMFVLYTNMLRSLAVSQANTLGMVVAALFGMLWFLFRDVRTALLGMAPNVLPILFILGAMGWAGIPLDMMTIMIASVSMGMAVDATIHYTFRWRNEVAAGVAPDDAILRSHESIGQAIAYTSVTVVGGFWVLVFSNFKPTIYFGVFTSLAMAAALLASLVLLPVLLRRWGPRPAR